MSRTRDKELQIARQRCCSRGSTAVQHRPPLACLLGPSWLLFTGSSESRWSVHRLRLHGSLEGCPVTSASQQGKSSHQHSCRPADSCQVSPEWQSLCIQAGKPDAGPCSLLLLSICSSCNRATVPCAVAWPPVWCRFTPCPCLQHGLPSHGSAAVAAASVAPAPWGPAQPATASPSRGSSRKVHTPCWPVVLACLLLAGSPRLVASQQAKSN